MKDTININNYEVFWIDYLDGNLTIYQENELMKFLEKNPSIANNLIDVQNFKLPIYKKEYPKKSSLYNKNQIENLLIAKIEGVINSENDAFITNKIKNDSKIAKLYSNYSKTVLVPDTNLVFPNKKSLKKSTRVPLFAYISSLAAMALILVISIYFINISNKPINNEVLNISTELKHVIYNHQIKDTITNKKQKTKTPINNAIFHTNSSLAKVKKEPIRLDVPSRLPLKKATKLNYEISFSTIDVMEYRYDLPHQQEQNQIVEYTIEYKKSKNENKFVTGLKNIINFRQKVNIVERWENIKKKKEEFLYTSLEK
ncbi:MAG: hypothetical protein PHW82_03380 [Bacteroidales bacterium]|nr:hypothetical protein [Bacteroidales bacterium]